MTIKNSFIKYWPLSHIYVIDTKEEQSGVHTLAEGVVSGITITESGEPTWQFTIGGMTEPVDVEAQGFDVFLSVSDYINQNPVERPVMYLYRFLTEELNVNPKALKLDAKNDVIESAGYYQGATTGVKVEFPDEWIFTKKIMATISGTLKPTPWTHNATWGNVTIYDTMAEVADNTTIQLKKLNGMVQDYGKVENIEGIINT